MSRTRIPDREKRFAEAITMISDGWTLKRTADELGMKRSTLAEWLAEDDSGRYTRARRLGAVARFEDMAEKLEQCPPDGPEVARYKALLENDRWALGKICRELFGDKVTHSGDPEAPLVHQVTRVVVDGRTKD